jgi:hypothetical protein
MMLMATDLGLCCNAVLLFHENRVRDLVKAPAGSRVVALLALGRTKPSHSGGNFPLQLRAPVEPRINAINIV